MINIFLILILSLVSNAAIDAKYDEFEGYELVRVLVDDNKLDVAQKYLSEMGGDQKSATHQYWSGVVQYKKGNYKKAIEHLTHTEFPKHSSEQNKRDLFLGRSYFYSENFKNCAQSFELAQSAKTEKDSLLLSDCYQKSQRLDKAWATLAGVIRTSKNLEALQVVNLFLTSQKMFLLATSLSLDWLAANSTQSSDFITIADDFNKQAHPEGRLKVLEMARAKYPLDVDINLNLNQIYFERGMLLAVEEGFSRAALSDGKYAYHAAEINRQAGRYERSQFFNARIPDDKERLKQKLAIYVDKGQFAMIASLESILQRSPLINDDEIRYALAYSLVRTGEYKRPLQYLAKITNKDFLEKTVILRNALTDCVENNKVCKL